MIGPELLGRLYDDHAPALRLYARQFGGMGSAEDAVQEAFLGLARRRSLPERVVPWLFRVVRNARLAADRADRRRRGREARASAPEGWFDPESDSDRLDAGDAARRLASLPAEVREAVVARIWGELTFEEIAALQGCSTATAHRRHLAGIARLQETFA